MADAEILREVERRLEAWFATAGWDELNAGLRRVQHTIEELRETGKSEEWE